MILVDTNVLSETSRKYPAPQVLQWLLRHGPDLRLPSVVLAELRYGVEKLPESRRRAELEDWLAKLMTRFAPHIVPFERSAAYAHGRLRARLKAIGKPMDAPDSYLAAIALAVDAEVATRNIAHFENAGLRLIDPWNA